MTIITKPVTDKKFDKLEEPLVSNEINEATVLHHPPKKDVEVELPLHMYQPLHARARRVHTATTLCACITAILVLTVGVIGGVYLYQQLSQTQTHRFRAWCNVLYPENRGMDEHTSAYQIKRTSYPGLPNSDSLNGHHVFFKQGVEIDEDHEEILVPDFTGSRRGRFIHDFSANKTGIIDLDGHRCFVMTLNRSMVLPPQSLYDLVLKMKAGYYEVDTEIVRQTMHIVYPPITNYKPVGYYIARECAQLKTYMLERVPKYRQRQLAKRSIDDSEHLYFTEFAGKNIIRFDIIDQEGSQSTVEEK